MITQFVGPMLIPSLAVIGAGILGALASLPALWRSAIQHFAAGVVFAAIATEIMPSVMHAGTPIAALIGFSAGIAAMFGMRSLAERLESVGDTRPGFPFGFIVAVSIDCVIDGIVIGTGFAAGAREGTLIAGALALEMFFLGLTAADTIKASGARLPTIVATCIGLALVLAASALVGFSGLNGAAASTLTLLLAFGSAALLYLVTEELLVRAHEHGETSIVTSLFFVGFMAIFAAELLSGGTTTKVSMGRHGGTVTAVPPRGNSGAAFLRGMVTHSDGAIDMAHGQVAKGTGPKVRALARDVIITRQT